MRFLTCSIDFYQETELIDVHHAHKSTKRLLSHATPLSAALCSALTVAPGLVLAQAASVTESVARPGHRQRAGLQSGPCPVREIPGAPGRSPQTISIVPAQVLEQQGAQSLQDVLRNVPGITFSSGEGGAGWGDMFTIRGFSAEQSITVDGVRDSQLSTRTDIFNMEQAEVYKGTGSIKSGVAAVGGSVNLVSKAPTWAASTTSTAASAPTSTAARRWTSITSSTTPRPFASMPWAITSALRNEAPPNSTAGALHPR